MIQLKNLLTEASNILVHNVNPDACEAFLRKYPKIRQTITAIARKNRDLMKGYKAFLRFKDSNEQYFGGRAEVTKSDTFGEKTFWKYDWMGVSGWAELYQYLDGVKESVNESSFTKGVTYGGTNCNGGCYKGKDGLAKIIKISKDNPNNVFMFRDDNYSGIQPHYAKNGVIAKANTLNPSYDLENSKVKNLKIGKDVIFSVRLFESVSEATTAMEGAWSLYVDGKKVKTFKSQRAAVIAQNNYTKTNSGWKEVTVKSDLYKESVNEIGKNDIERMLSATNPGEKLELTLDNNKRIVVQRVGTDSKKQPTFKHIQNNKAVGTPSPLAANYIVNAKKLKESVKEAVTVKDYDEHVNPFKLTIHLSNGKSIDIKPKSNYREKSYQFWIQLLKDYDHNSKAKETVDTVINRMIK